MRPGKVGFLAILTGLCVVLAACGRPSDNGPVQPGGPGMTQSEVQRQDAITQWANDYCIAAGTFINGLAAMPSIDPSTPRRAVQTSSDLLGSMISGLDTAVGDLRALPPAPMPGADSVRSDAVAQLTGIRQQAASAKQRLDDSSAVNESTLAEARGPLDKVSTLNPLSGFDRFPDLRAAAARAPVCQQLTARPTS